MIEQFKDVKNFEGHYKVSNFGRVIDSEGNEKKLYLTARPSMIVSLTREGFSQSLTVSALVANTFFSTLASSKTKIVHIDGDIKNNRADNLDRIPRNQRESFEKQGYSFKVFDDRNRLCFVTPVRYNASKFVWDALGYRPEQNLVGQLLGGTYRIEKFKPKSTPFINENTNKWLSDSDCIGSMYK